MDVSAIRGRFAEVAVRAVKPAQAAMPSAVPTELPADQAVGAAWGGSAAGHDPGSPEEMERRCERDAETQALVFKTIDPVSGEVVFQMPDQAILSLRAYLEQMKDMASRRGSRSTFSTTA